MYNYNYDVSYILIDGDEGDTAYRKNLLCAFNLTEWDSRIMNVQDNIFEKFKNNPNLKNLLIKGKEFGFNIPFELDEKTTFTMFFSFPYFESFHKCLKNLFNNKDISNENFTEMLNLLS